MTGGFFLGGVFGVFRHFITKKYAFKKDNCKNNCNQF